MWKQAKVTAGGENVDQAMVDFEGKQPVVLEWPTPLLLNREITIGDETFYAGAVEACARKFHHPLMREPLLSEEEKRKLSPPPAVEASLPEPEPESAAADPEPSRKRK